MIAAVLTFGGVALAMNGLKFGQDAELLSWIGIGFAAMMTLNHFIIPNIVAKSALKRLSAEDVRNGDEHTRFQMIFPIFRTRLIIACAMLEGAAFLNLVATVTVSARMPRQNPIPSQEWIPALLSALELNGRSSLASYCCCRTVF